MTLLAKMDRLVFATRLDRLLFMKVKPRSLRWTPLFVLAALVAGYVLIVKAESSPNRTLLVGAVMFYSAYGVAFLLWAFGPRFAATAPDSLDERELTVKNRAYAASGILLTGVTMLGCFYIAGAAMIGLWQPHSPNDWIALGFGIQAVAMLLPTLIASWLEPRTAADQED